MKPRKNAPRSAPGPGLRREIEADYERAIACRCQAETPLIARFKITEPALLTGRPKRGHAAKIARSANGICSDVFSALFAAASDKPAFIATIHNSCTRRCFFLDDQPEFWHDSTVRLAIFLVPVRNGAARMTPVKHCQYCSTPVHLYARLCIHCMREIDTAEHIQQMRRTRQRLFALVAATIIAAVVGLVAPFMVSPDPPPRPQMQTAVDASPTRTAPEARVEAPAPVVAPAQATEGTKRKITRQPSHDRSLYIDLRLR